MNTKNADVSNQWFANLSSLLPDLEALYTDIHAHPELSMQETRTADLAASRLRQSGFEVTTGIGHTGVVGLLRNGDGPTVMLRADMDALPVAEATGLPYASKVTAKDKDGHTVPVMHACGHDMHVTSLVGETATLCGWVNKIRLQAHVAFVDLRDHEGLAQVVVERENAAAFAVAG